MFPKVTVKVLGMPELLRVLKETPAAMVRVVPESSQAGAEVVRRAVEPRVPVGRHSGHHMKADLTTELDTAPEFTSSGGFLGRLEGAAAKASTLVGFSKRGWYWRLVEYGHAVAPRDPSGKVLRISRSKKFDRKQLGHVPAHPFVRPAFDENIDRTAGAQEDVLMTAFDQAAAK